MPPAVPQQQVELARRPADRAVGATVAPVGAGAVRAERDEPALFGVAGATSSRNGSSTRSRPGRAMKPQSNSSIPSTANPGAYVGVRSPACSASARWIAASCAWRRAQNASGDGAGRKLQHCRSGGAARRAATSAACCSRYHSTGSPAGISTSSASGAAAGSARAKAAAQSCTPPVCASRSRTDQPGHAGTGAAGPARAAAAASAAPCRSSSSTCCVTSTPGGSHAPPTGPGPNSTVRGYERRRARTRARDCGSTIPPGGERRAERAGAGALRTTCRSACSRRTSRWAAASRRPGSSRAGSWRASSRAAWCCRRCSRTTSHRRCSR